MPCCTAEPIRVGDKVVVWYTSANRDEDVFADPYRFDLARNPNPQISFGLGGPHRCLGEHLARLEINVVLAELLRHVNRLELAGSPRRIRSNFTNGLKLGTWSFEVQGDLEQPACW